MTKTKGNVSSPVSVFVLTRVSHDFIICNNTCVESSLHTSPRSRAVRFITGMRSQMIGYTKYGLVEANCTHVYLIYNATLVIT